MFSLTSAASIFSANQINSFVKQNLLSSSSFFITTGLYGLCASGLMVIKSLVEGNKDYWFSKSLLGLGFAGLSGFSSNRVIVPVISSTNLAVNEFSNADTVLGFAGAELSCAAASALSSLYKNENLIKVASSISSLASLNIGIALAKTGADLTQRFLLLSREIIAGVLLNSLFTTGVSAIGGMVCHEPLAERVLTAAATSAVASCFFACNILAGVGIYRVANKISSSSCVRGCINAVGDFFQRARRSIWG